MSNEAQKKFFDQLLLEGARNSAFRLQEVTGHTGSAQNPMCGDLVEIGFSAGDHKDLHHSGEGCILSQAFAAIACKELQGDSKEQIKQKIAALRGYLAAGKAEQIPSLLANSGFAAAQGLLEFATRHSCILLFAEALVKAWGHMGQTQNSEDLSSCKPQLRQQAKE
jgi:NifU-like protein involved in Fe-S cluster formation